MANSLQPPPYDITSDATWHYNTFGDSDDGYWWNQRRQARRNPAHLLISLILFLGCVGFMFWAYDQVERSRQWLPGLPKVDAQSLRG